MVTVYPEWVRPTVQIGTLFPSFHWFVVTLHSPALFFKC